MGKEREWVTMKENYTLNISENEWTLAEGFIRELIENKKETPPFKLSRKDLQEKYPELAAEFHHSFIVVSDTDPANKNGFKIAAMARGKSYTRNDEQIEEGILGSGASGVVKMVQWRNGSRDAVKIEPGDEKTSLEIMKEIGTLKAAFLRVRGKMTPWIGKNKIQNKQYILQKLEKGLNMSRYLTSMELGLTSTEQYVIPIEAARAIQGLHDRDILHCDIKPANFMINVQKKVTVVVPIDFDISKKLKPGENKVVTNSSAGTKFYMAPEVRKRETYSKSSDIYSLGKMFQKDLNLDEEEPALKELVERMVSDDPGKRPKISEVVSTLIDPKNYKDYEKLYAYLEEYRHENFLKNKASRFPFLSAKTNNDASLKVVADLNNILNFYRGKNPDNQETKEKESEMVVNTILIILKENQMRSQKTNLELVEPSLFNLNTIQKLPLALREKVLEKLDIKGEDEKNFLRNTSLSNRKLLAVALSKYNLPLLEARGEVKERREEPK